MNCPLKSEDTLDTLLDYAAGKVDTAKAGLLEQHLIVCADCTAFLAGQNEVLKALDAWEPEPVGIDFNRQLWQRIDAVDAEPWYRKLADSLSMGAWKPAVPLTAAVFLVATAFMMDHQTAVKVTAPNAGSGYAVSVTEAEQLENTLDDIQLLRQLDAAAGGESSGSKTM
jgi:hypothetical protein